MSGYIRVGSEFVVNSTYARSQAQPDSTRLSNGSFLVVWIDADFNTTANRFVRAQLFAADGSPLGTELTLRTTGGGASYPTVSGLAGGGFVVLTTALAGITGRIFDASGIATGAEFSVTASSASNIESVALANGGFAVVWHDARTSGGDISGSGVHVSTYGADGVAIASGVLVNTVTSGNQADASIAALAGGGYIVTWTDRSSGTGLIKGQIFDPAGTKVGGEIGITVGSAIESSVTLLANGNFAVAWYEGGTHHVQVYSAGGTAIGNQIAVSAQLSGIQTGPQLAALSNGGFVLTWVGNYGAQSDGSGSGIFFQAFDSNAQSAGSPELVNTLLAGDQIQPTVTALDNAGFVISWTDLGVAGADNDQVRSQIFTFDSLSPAPSAVHILSAGGGDTGIAQAAERDAAVAFVRAEAPASSSVHYAITGGADAALFTIDAVTGLLRFVGVPDFETPIDSDADNLYQLVVTASDDLSSDSQALTVQLLDMNDGPVVTSTASYSVSENTTAVGNVTAIDPEGDAILYGIAGGADADKFVINSATGAISFWSTAPNYESPSDANRDNVFDLIVSANDANGSGFSYKTVTIMIANVIEGTAITSNGGGASAALIQAENLTYVTTVVARDYAGPTVAYTITGGSDASKFTINAQTGVLSFVSAPNYEAPNDSGLNRVYDVIVAASDGQVTDTQALAITITNVNEAPVITSNGGGDTAAINFSENSSFIGLVSATDPENNPRTYSIIGGADAAKFTISGGALSFVAAPNFEAPTDAGANNVYDVIIQASDGSLTDTQALAITVTNINEAPTIATAAAFSVQENTLFAANIVASDPDGQTLTYSITGGLDAARFTINAQTGALNFVATPNFESPVDNGANNIYNVTVGVSDGAITTTKALAITVSNVNEAPVITSNGGGDSAVLTVAENGTAIGTITSTDPEVTARTYAIAGGADAARFAINATTGALSFVAAPNFEAPADVNGDNVYQVIVSASDGALSDTQALSVTVGNVNETPTITSASSFSVVENVPAAGTITSTDPEGTPRTYAIIGGADATKFTIDAASGALNFVAAPDYETPADADGDNVYQVTVRASDGSLFDTKALSVTVTNANEAPIITSNGGGDTAVIGVTENGVAVTVVGATDPENAPRLFAIAGGADAAKFTIDPATGALSFLAPPDYEARADANGDNAYEVVVSASDGNLADTQTLTVVIDNQNEGPSFDSAASIAASENVVAVAVVHAADPEGASLTYAILGGADAAKFTIDAASGVLSFVSAPDFEALGDTDGNNVYDVIVSASDGSLTASQTVAVAVTDTNEAPSFVSAGTLTAAENAVAAGLVHASDPDGETLVYAIVGGADAMKFAIDAATGALSFVSVPDYETPVDAGGDNFYQVIVSASDGFYSTSQALTVLVGNIDEAPTIVSDALFTVAENATAAGTIAANDPEGAAILYTIGGGADAALFAIDAATGALSFVAAPNFEVPGDSNADNIYEVVIAASDGGVATSRAITVLVSNVSEAPVITSNGGGDSAVLTVAENGTAIGTITSTDPEATARTYAIAGGADAARFAINATTGALSFVAASNFEAPADVNGDNVYQVIVSASDGALSDSQALSVTVGNVNESPTITSNGGGDSANVTINENASAVTTVVSADPDGVAPTYAITGGADGARFAINAITGALSFVAAPNFEAPADSNGDNAYQVIVTASDGSLSDSQTIVVTVANIIDGVTLTGTAKADTLTGGAAEDTLAGLGGADTLNGAGGADILDGAAGTDTLVGGAGADRLTGGAAADTFVYQSLGDSSVALADFLTDFSTSQGDKINLSAIDANGGLAGNQAFAWIGTGAFSGVAGQLRYYQSGGDTFITGDVNGDGVGDFLIQIDPLVAFTAGNFIL